MKKTILLTIAIVALHSAHQSFAVTPLPSPVYTNSFANNWFSGSVASNVTTKNSTPIDFGGLCNFVAPKDWHLMTAPMPVFGSSGNVTSHVLYYVDTQTNVFCVTCSSVNPYSGTGVPSQVSGAYTVLLIRQGH